MKRTTTAPTTDDLPMDYTGPKPEFFPLFNLKNPTVNICMRTGAQTRQLVDTSIFDSKTVAVAESENIDPLKLINFAQIADAMSYCHSDKIKDNRWNLSFKLMKTMYNGTLDDIEIPFGHLAFVPRRPVSSDGVQEFDTRVVLSEYCKPCCSIRPVKEYKCVIEKTVPTPEWELLYDFGNSGNLPTANSKQMWTKCVLEKARYSMGGANNVAVFVKLWLLHALVSRYSDFDNLENYEYVIDEDNRPFFGTWTAKSIPENAIAEEPDWSAHSKCSHIFAQKFLTDSLAHCLFLAILPWPVWTGPANVVVPPELAVSISGDKGTDICFITDAITKESFGDVIKMPSSYDVEMTIKALANMEYSHEEACRAREIAARLTFYWPSHCKPEQQREIKNVDAANLSTFLNNNLILPKPSCVRSFVSNVVKPESDRTPWFKRLYELFRLFDEKSILYDSLLGRSLLYAQDSVAQSLCHSADFIMSQNSDDGDGTPFGKHKYTAPNCYIRMAYDQPTKFQSRCYTVGNSIFGFMPSRDSLRWCYESNDWSRAVYSSLRLPNRLVLRQMSSAQVFDIMKNMPDTCYIATGIVSISNLSWCFDRVSESELAEFNKNSLSLGVVPFHPNKIVNNNTVGARFGSIFRCFGADSNTSTLQVVCRSTNMFEDDYPTTRELIDEKIIRDPVFVNWPEEATWTTVNVHTGCVINFYVFCGNHRDQLVRWAVLFTQFLGLNNDECRTPVSGLIHRKMNPFIDAFPFYFPDLGTARLDPELALS